MNVYDSVTPLRSELAVETGRGCAMVEKERRSGSRSAPAQTLRQLNDAQRLTLMTLEKFGWELRFVRRPLFMPAMPVVFDPEHRKFAVLEADGSLNEAAALTLRD
jgi:hypothetical protein